VINYRNHSLNHLKSNILKTYIAENLVFSESVSTIELLIQEIFFQALARTTTLHLKISVFRHNCCIPSKESLPVRMLGMLGVCLVANFYQ
jgi:hypothetical protein